MKFREIANKYQLSCPSRIFYHDDYLVNQSPLLSMYQEFYKKIEAAEKTATYDFIKKLDDNGLMDCAITQNIDGLIRNVLPKDKLTEMHGCLFVR